MSAPSSIPVTSTSRHPPNNANLGIRNIIEEKFEFEGWSITILKSPIIPSQCYCAQGTITISKHSSLTSATDHTQQHGVRSPPGTICQVCRFGRDLALHHLPEMVFPDNVLNLVYEPSGLIMQFNALDAMKRISTDVCAVHVACSDEWKASKVQTGLPVGEALAPYDWTYSTDYKGSVEFTNTDLPQPLITVDSSSQLNLDKLRQHENILFFGEIPLYEDELHDNGISNLSVKLRVMPSGFFILLRFFLRVDQVLVRLCDTRIYFETGNSYFIRQVQVREERYENLTHLQPHVFTDPNVLYPNIPVRQEINERIHLIPSTTSPTAG